MYKFLLLSKLSISVVEDFHFKEDLFIFSKIIFTHSKTNGKQIKKYQTQQSDNTKIKKTRNMSRVHPRRFISTIHIEDMLFN